MEKFSIRTTGQFQLLDITSHIQKIIADSRLKNGVCYVFIPHTTAAVTINENADPDVKADILMEINKIIPFSDSYHHMEGNSAAHIKASLIGNSETIFIENGHLRLGTWQGVYFCEFDGPRSREVWVKIITS
jgi:secondary thiamine-phosphate synthase enzyme